MKKLALSLIVIALSLAGCAPLGKLKVTPTSPAGAPPVAVAATATESEVSVIPATSTPTRAPRPSPTATKTPTKAPTATSSPASGVSPTLTSIPTITPMAISTVAQHPHALNEENTAAHIQMLSRMGTGTVYDVVWSPDGKFLAVSTGIGVYLYDAVTIKQIRFFNLDKIVSAMAFSPDGMALAIARNGRVSLWNARSGYKISELNDGIAGGITKLVYGKYGYLAAYGKQCIDCTEVLQQVIVWDVATGGIIYTDNNIPLDSRAIDLNPDGRSLIYWGKYGLEVHEIRSKKIITILDETAYDVLFSSDGKNAVTTALNEPYTVKLWNLATGTSTPILEATPCQNLAHTRTAAICYSASTAVIFDLTSGQPLKTLDLSGQIDRAVISSDSNQLAYMDQDTVKVWDIQKDQQVKVLDYNRFQAIATGILPINGKPVYLAATGDLEGRIEVWNLASREVIQTFTSDDKDIRGLAFSPDRRTLISIDGKGVIRLWDIPDGKQTFVFDYSGQANGPIATSPDGTKLALLDAPQENILELNFLSSKLELRGVNYRPGSYDQTLFYGPFLYTKSNHLMSWGYTTDTSTLTWDDLTLNSSLLLPYIRGSDPDNVETIALSPDGKYLAVGTTGARIDVWELSKRTIYRQLFGHSPKSVEGWTGTFQHLEFSPFTNVLMSVGWDGTTRMWSIQTGNPIRILDECCLAAFSPDGRFLVTASQGAIYVWGIPPWP